MKVLFIYPEILKYELIIIDNCSHIKKDNFTLTDNEEIKNWIKHYSDVYSCIM